MRLAADHVRVARMRVLPVVAAGACLIGPLAAHAAGETLDKVDAPGSIEAWGGNQIYGGSKTETSTGFVIRHDGRIFPLAGAHDPDIGPGPNGTVRVVDVAASGQVAVTRIDGTGARTVPHTKGARATTIWGSRVAWMRRDGRLMTSRLDGTQAKLLKGAPARLCYGSGKCYKVDADVRDFKLYRNSLAILSTFAHPTDDPNCCEDEYYDDLRIEDVRTGRVTEVAQVTWGQAGRGLLGPSWAGGKLFYYQSCLLQGSCGTAFRYDPVTGAGAQARRRRRLSGFAIDDDGKHAFEIPNYSSIDPDADGEEPSMVVRVALKFRRR